MLMRSRRAGMELTFCSISFGGGFELMHEGDRDGIYRTMVAGLQ